MNFIILVNATSDIQRKLTKTPDPCCSKWRRGAFSSGGFGGVFYKGLDKGKDEWNDKLPTAEAVLLWIFKLTSITLCR